jgi:hypothetical protein
MGTEWVTEDEYRMASIAKIGAGFQRISAGER